MLGLLVAFMNPPVDEAAFNAWYDEEHVPLRLGVPGFLNARRYRAPDETSAPARASATTMAPAVGPQDSLRLTRAIWPCTTSSPRRSSTPNPTRG